VQVLPHRKAGKKRSSNIMALLAELFAANENQLSCASGSMSSGSLVEPPLSPGMPKLSHGLLKRQDSDTAHSLTSTTASPMGNAMDNESVMSPGSRGSSASPDSQVCLRGCREMELSTASVIERARQIQDVGRSDDMPPVPGYCAPDIMPPGVPPPPGLPGCREVEPSTASVSERARQMPVLKSSNDRPPVPGYFAPDIMPPDFPPPCPSDCREVELSTASAPEQAGQAPVRGSSKDLPPVPGYLAPDILPPDVPPPPVLPPGTSEFGLPEWKAAAHQPQLVLPASPSFGGCPEQGLCLPDASDRAQLLHPLLPFTKASLTPEDELLQQHFVSAVGLSNESCAMIRERSLIPANGLLSMKYSTGSAACNVLSEYNKDISQALAVIDLLRTGPAVPPLPPAGCYGGVHVSSAISEGLGVEAAGAAEAAARDFGDRPLKVVLPWYPVDAGISMFDKTKAVKIPLAF